MQKRTKVDIAILKFSDTLCSTYMHTIVWLSMKFGQGVTVSMWLLFHSVYRLGGGEQRMSAKMDCHGMHTHTYTHTHTNKPATSTHYPKVKRPGVLN